MPIHVDIKINDTLISSLHIGRVSGGTNPTDINPYLVVRGANPRTISEWDDYGVGFYHTYGDGAEVCVYHALTALNGGSRE